MHIQDSVDRAGIKRRVARGLALVDKVESHGDLYKVKGSGGWYYTVNLNNENGETCGCKPT